MEYLQIMSNASYSFDNTYVRSCSVLTGVGFKVAGDTSIKTLVLQVHYKDVTAFLPPSEYTHTHTHTHTQTHVHTCTHMDKTHVDACTRDMPENILTEIDNILAIRVKITND